MTRIRLFGMHVGQIDAKIIEEYRKFDHFDRLIDVIHKIIEKKILGYEIKSVDDIVVADKCIKAFFYKNIGEYIEAYMREEIISHMKICKNCFLNCEDKRSDYQKGCIRYTKYGTIVNPYIRQ